MNFQPIQILSGYGAKFDVYDSLGNNPIHYGATSNAGTVIRFLGQRGQSTFDEKKNQLLTYDFNANISFLHR